MTGLITRQQMVDAIAADFNANVTEHVGHNWNRVNAMVADQGNGAAVFHGFDFHILELYLSGSHIAQGDGDFVQGNTWSGTYLPGSVSYMQNATSFSLEFNGQAKIQQIYLDPTFFSDCAASVFKGDPDTMATRASQGFFDPLLKRLGDLLLEEARRPALGSDLNADLIGQQIALQVLRVQNEKRLKELRERRLDMRELDKILSYLEDQIEDIGGMDTLAALIDMDVYSFTKAFKATTGESPGQFLIQRRLARVKDLLRTTNDSLADISYATGFSNQPHMTSTFSKHFGTSPGKWRKAVRS